MLSEDLQIDLLEKPNLLSAVRSTGYRTWEAALPLASSLAISPEKVEGKKVLELGAGTGLLSFLCAKHLNASRVVATDGDAVTVDRLTTSNAHNGFEKPHAESKTKFGIFRWGEPFAGTLIDEELKLGLFDIVLAADVVRALRRWGCPLLTVPAKTYEPSSFPALVKTLCDILSVQSCTEILVSAPIRNQETLNVFLNICGQFQTFFARTSRFPF